MLERYAYLWIRYREFERFLRNTAQGRATQHKVLLDKVRRHADSQFGRDHDFQHIRTVEDFRRRVPITTYEYYQSYIDRLKLGQINALFGPGTRLLMFAMTSGTTSKPKYIPITNHFFREYRRGWTLWGLRMYWQHKDLVHKKTIKLASDWQQEQTPAGIPCGNISGLVAETAPWIAQLRFLLPRSIIKIHDPQAKHYTALRLALCSDNVGLIGTANPATLVELARLAEREQESLIRDIYDGSLRKDLPVPVQVRKSLQKYLKPNPRRAKRLEQIVHSSGRLRLPEAWPRLSLLAVWLGGSAGVYAPLLRQYYGDVPLRDHGLSASEGRMAIPIEDGTSAGVLEYVNHFFEFIPEDEHGKPNPTVLEAHELEEGRNYYIILTTSAGLYRYDIHDVVQCTGFVGQVPLVKFLNKGAHFSSITGEKLTEAQVIEAVRKAYSRFGLQIGTFTLAPVMGERPRYLLLVEPGPHRGIEAQLAATIDSELARQNWEYANRLQTRRLDPVQICEVPPGTWHAFRQRRIAERGNLEEYKHPFLVGDLKFVERLRVLQPKHVPTHHLQHTRQSA